jgi:exonuclease SbcC
MITRLALENWKTHESTEFEFGKGTNVLVGPMGSGKSSAMDAISFALFGTFPSHNQKKLKLDDMIMNKPERKASAKIVLSFKVDGKEYTVKREITRGKGQTSAEIRLDDRLIETANQRVNERIADILRINYDLFSRAVYAEQNNIDYFLEIPKAKRREKIDELLKIDKFESARKNLTTVNSRLAERINDKSASIENQQDTGEIPELEKAVDNEAKALERKEVSLLTKKKDREMAEANYNEILKKRSAFAELDGKIKEGKGRVETFEEKLKSYGEVRVNEEELKTRIKRKMEERKELRGALDLRAKREAERDTLRALLESHEKNIAEFDSILKELRYDKNAPARFKECAEGLEKVKETLEKTVTNYNSVNLRLAEIEESIRNLKTGAEKCPTCDAELDEDKVREILEKRKIEKGKLDKQGQELEKDIARFGELRKRLEKELEELRNAMNNLEKAEWANKEREKRLKEITPTKQNLEVILKQLESIKIEKSEEILEKEVKELEELLYYFIYKKELEKARFETDKLKRELEKLGFKEEDEKRAYDKFKELDKDLAVQVQECKNLSDLIVEKRKRLENLKKIRDEVEKGKKEIEFLGKKIDSFEILQHGLEKVQGMLREEFTAETNLALTDIWKKLYPYVDYVNLKLSVDEAGDYILQLQRRDGLWINVEGTSSGGERSIACLALRIALSLVLTQNLSWLVLDEPTHNLDRRAIKELSVTLREHLPKIVDQIFIITHEEELESAASGYLYRLERNKEEDEPTKIVVETAY